MSYWFPGKYELYELLKQGAKIMSKLDDLNAAVSAMASAVSELTTNLSANDAAIQNEIQALQDAIAAGNSTAIDAAVANISTLSAKVKDSATAIKGETDRLAASLQPAAGATGATGP